MRNALSVGVLYVGKGAHTSSPVREREKEGGRERVRKRERIPHD